MKFDARQQIYYSTLIQRSPLLPCKNQKAVLCRKGAIKRKKARAKLGDVTTAVIKFSESYVSHKKREIKVEWHAM